MNPKLLLPVILMLFALAVPCMSQEEDTTLVLPPVDTTEVMPVPADSALSDTLTAEQKALLEFEKRQQEYQETRIERKPDFSFRDSLLSALVSPRLDQRIQIDRSFYHDAGDYFRFDPSFFVLDHQTTPMRKTVQPFGLKGNRLNVISNRLAIDPFEHVIEPDGLMDLNDIPTALDGHMYVIPGAVGMFLGGQGAVASLVTMPRRPESNFPESGLMADQGNLEYNFVRGRYSKLFANSREIDLSIGYRNADGISFLRVDDAYHYTGRIRQPLGLNYGLAASGYLYGREGGFVVRPGSYAGTELSVPAIDRNRIDRSAEIYFDRQNSDHDARMAAGYRYVRHGSHIDGPYKGRFDITGWGLFALREWITGNSLFNVELASSHIEYTDGYENYVRDRGEASAGFAAISPTTSFALTAGGTYIDGFDFMPRAAAVLSVDKDLLYILLSAGYAERAPTLYERHLRFQRAQIYATAAQNYADQGNMELKKERQLVGSALLELGSITSNVRLSVTGGTIADAIEWNNTLEVDGLGDTYTLFSPINEDITFADASLQQRLGLNDVLSLRSGVAYHYTDFAIMDDKAYIPEYQAFSGLELHVYWPQKIMDLLAYGEIVYWPEYDGYETEGLGGQIVTNVKLSFQIKRFRMHYVIQNLFSQFYEPREGLATSGRFDYFGIIWNFLD